LAATILAGAAAARNTRSATWGSDDSRIEPINRSAM
jgi:hypothetical protein